MKANIFDYFKSINESDTKNNTQFLQISNHVHAARKVKAGAIVEMGTTEKILHDIMNDEVIVLLIVIDKKEYKRIEKENS